MVAVNPPGPTGFGPTAGPTNVDQVSFVDTVDGTPVIVPSFNTSASPTTPPTFTRQVINPVAVADTVGTTSQNAMLVELRVLNRLLHMQIGANGGVEDLNQMRADEAWEMNLSTGGMN